MLYIGCCRVQFQDSAAKGCEHAAEWFSHRTAAEGLGTNGYGLKGSGLQLLCFMLQTWFSMLHAWSRCIVHCTCMVAEAVRQLLLHALYGLAHIWLQMLGQLR